MVSVSEENRQNLIASLNKAHVMERCPTTATYWSATVKILVCRLCTRRVGASDTSSWYPPAIGGLFPVTVAPESPLVHTQWTGYIAE